MQLVNGRFQQKLDKWNIHHGVNQISISQNVIFSSLKICSLSSIHSCGQSTLHMLVALYVTISSFPSFFLPFFFSPLPPSLPSFLSPLLPSFLPYWKWKCRSLSCVRLFATPWTVAHRAPLSIEFTRQEYWRGLPCPSPGDLPNPGTKPRSPSLQADSLPSEPPGKPLPFFLPYYLYIFMIFCFSNIPVVAYYVCMY